MACRCYIELPTAGRRADSTARQRRAVSFVGRNGLAVGQVAYWRERRRVPSHSATASHNARTADRQARTKFHGWWNGVMTRPRNVNVMDINSSHCTARGILLKLLLPSMPAKVQPLLSAQRVTHSSRQDCAVTADVRTDQSRWRSARLRGVRMTPHSPGARAPAAGCRQTKEPEGVRLRPGRARTRRSLSVPMRPRLGPCD